MHLLIAYDIANPRRLARVAKLMEDYGRRVQLSVFEAELDPRVFSTMQARVAGVIESEADGVKYFPLCRECLKRVRVLGRGSLPEAEAPYLVL